MDNADDHVLIMWGKVAKKEGSKNCRMEAIWDQNAGVFGIQGKFYLPKSKNKLWLIALLQARYTWIEFSKCDLVMAWLNTISPEALKP